MDHVRVCGGHRFQRGLDEIMKVIADHAILADLWAREIVKLRANEIQDAENAREIRQTLGKLEDENEAIADVEGLYDEVMKDWYNIKLHRNIEHVKYAAAITVDEGGPQYTSDWAVFLAAQAKVKAQFEGNVVDLGSKYSPRPYRHVLSCRRWFDHDLTHPADFDSKGQRCLIVSKDGNSTDLTVEHYAGLVSSTQNKVGIESIELGIYNLGNKTAEVFSSKGDSGSLPCLAHEE
ncbi:hypothetical protein F5050DRAFT_1809631 [Lentinula boryana]|uniref:Uncharacterized protein n=1 Tax=Lentinula boryana TaxID=40481 RepID=A0ABQ8Q7A4_9AGAR|nr:hypothetical protein F5050DRAFT_1809631 [Lentinula boryana]